jgi:hypothetical protein
VSALETKVWNSLNEAGIGDWPQLAEKVKGGEDAAAWMLDLPNFGPKSVVFVKQLLIAEGKTADEYPWFEYTWVKEAEDK